MDSRQDGSKALVRKRSDTDLMPPPPRVKKIKRPKQVLDEDEYTDVLSRIIARDFFPGIEISAIQNEYLNAVEARDTAWISSAGRKLQDAMTPGRLRTRSASRKLQDGAQTPTTSFGETPNSVASSTLTAEKTHLGARMSLSKFQATYTSEDNESFYKLVDQQNQKNADKCAWMWNNNKLPSKHMLKQKEIIDRLKKSGQLDGFRRDKLGIKDADQRPAQPDTWKAAPRNGLMFVPEGLNDDVVSMAQRDQDQSHMAPMTIAYENTKMPQPDIPQRPPSPTMSAVRDAISSRPRPRDQDSTIMGGDETPRVNGYRFVDDEDEDTMPAAPSINLGPGDSHNPFKIQEQRKRETLHERLVERVAKSNKEVSGNGLSGRTDKLKAPKFASSPRVAGDLTPAAQRLLSQMATPKNRTPSSPFGESTPRKPKSSLLRSVTRPGGK
ncbi:hypothetical protein CDD81_7374 [Ophiocordyceps australis]|uniref:Nuclear protein Es2 n=1 Tax=Ophiocordyceps australis TaxID=1399860 RepID=A0A2C5Y432_9HYPO|nr:hypothetical protein CDD81_7374 [Ophiocordyceps australis]